MNKREKLMICGIGLFVICMIANPALGAPKEIFLVPFICFLASNFL